MHCQTACPENRGVVLPVQAAADFSEEETRFLLDVSEPSGLPRALVAKLEERDLLDMADTCRAT